MLSNVSKALLLAVGLVALVQAEIDMAAWKNAQRTLKDSFLQELANERFNSESFRPASSKAEMETTSYSLTGFVFTNYFYGTDGAPDTTCADQSQAVMYPVNLCHSNGTYNVKLQIVDDSCTGGVVQYFSDSACTDFIGTSSLEGYDACTTTKGNNNVPEGTTRTVTCSTAASPYIDDTFGYTEDYIGDTCTGQIAYATAYQLNTCLPQDGLGVRFVCSNGDPIANAFISLNCTGDPFVLTLSDTCGPVTAGDDDDYTPPFINSPKSRALSTESSDVATAAAVAMSGLNYCPVHAPTLKPAFAPTAYPTASAATTVTFKVTQGLSGISAETFNGNANNANTMKKTIAQSMTGTTSNSILDLTVVTNLNRRLKGSATMLATAVTTSTMSYTVSVSTTMSSTQLFNQLEGVITSGAFTSALFTNANADGTTDLVGVTSNSVVMGSNSADDDGTSGDNDDDSLSKDDVIYIGVGCGVGGALIAAIAVYCFMNRRSTPMASQHGGDSSA